MSESAGQPVQPPLRTWRPIALWTAGILLALGLAWFVGAVVVPVWQTRAAVTRCYDRRALLARALVDEVDVLGGPDEATQKLGLYLRVPDPLAPHRMIATRMLGECGRCAVPALKSLLDDEDKTVRYWAAWELGNVGTAAEDTAPALTRALADADGDVRQAAADALKKIRGDEAKP